ncbi:hypothetical protein EYZ11_002130 [Aspergillus tanneri]|uniref:Uncharacterized protein n=1 Tax=Aspergillus tanneri TaxID=1220188 RepID=A0A4S3JU63_9EURO|nr:hypothetical protein EYZ11_002130 [Aspergillus tanneri]
MAATLYRLAASSLSSQDQAHSSRKSALNLPPLSKGGKALGKRAQR